MPSYYGRHARDDDCKQRKMGQAVTQDFSNATEIADYLASKGLPFRQAHEIVGKLVLHCTQKGIYLVDVPLATYKEMSLLFEEDLYEVLSPYAAVKRRNSAGGTGFEQIEKALEKAKGLTKEVIKN